MGKFSYDEYVRLVGTKKIYGMNLSKSIKNSLFHRCCINIGRSPVII